MYLERRLVAAVRGDAHFDFSAIIGWKHLGKIPSPSAPWMSRPPVPNTHSHPTEESVNQFGKDHEFTKLCINHDGVNPDDAFSTVPYEKGFHFVYYLERVVGRANFDKFIPYYFGRWANKSLDSFQFRSTFEEFFAAPEYAHLADAIASIDWHGRFTTPGLPPKPDFDTSLVDVCYSLADKWAALASSADGAGFQPSPQDVASWTGNQMLVFLNVVQDFPSPLSVPHSRLLGATYGLQSSRNVDLQTAYYQIALQARDGDSYASVADLLGRVGRMKFVRPLFRSLNRADRDLALRTFEKNRYFYHPICRAMVEKDLGIVESGKSAA